MKYIITITLLMQALFGFIGAHAQSYGYNIKIEKQRLVKFPEDPYQYQTSQQTKETRRILNEIEKINLALGYVKKIDQQFPAILDSNLYLYPKPSYHPLNSASYNSDGSLKPSIRNFRMIENSVSRPNSDMPIDQNAILLKFRPDTDSNNNKQYRISGDLRKFYNLFQMNNVKSKTSSQQESSMKNKNINNDDNVPMTIDFETVEEMNDKFTRGERFNIMEKVEMINANNGEERSNSKIKQITQLPLTGSTGSTIPMASVKNSFSTFFNKHSNKPNTQEQTLLPTQTKPAAVTTKSTTIDDYDMQSSDESSEDNDAEKHIFGHLHNQDKKQPDGSIIIQRLKVRKGGIAIAGPGGIATAGSGGTAIVGPHGYAFTHPRSLTIAGPGTKIVALPETTDLKDVLLRTILGKSLPIEGRIVATGPAIYYNNPDLY